MITVVALRTGYIYGRLRNEGDTFEAREEDVVGASWVRPVGQVIGLVPELPPTPVEPKSKKARAQVKATAEAEEAARDAAKKKEPESDEADLG